MIKTVKYVFIMCAFGYVRLQFYTEIFQYMLDKNV